MKQTGLNPWTEILGMLDNDDLGNLVSVLWAAGKTPDLSSLLSMDSLCGTVRTKAKARGFRAIEYMPRARIRAFSVRSFSMIMKVEENG